VKRVAVYCGSRDGARPEYRQQARALGRALADAGLGMVYGGAQVGMMGAVADGVLDGGAEVVGVLPKGLARAEFAHERLTRLEYVDTMGQRKDRMAELADGFIALPGGFGTLDELFEVLTQLQIGLHRKPVGLLDTRGYWGPLVAQIELCVREGFVPEQLATALVVDADPVTLVAKLRAHEVPPPAVQWGQK